MKSFILKPQPTLKKPLATSRPMSRTDTGPKPN